MPLPNPQAAARDVCPPGPGHGAERGPSEGASTWIHTCAPDPPPKDRHTDRHGHGWPQVPEASGSGGEDSGQTPERTSPASKAPRREEGYWGRWEAGGMHSRTWEKKGLQYVKGSTSCPNPKSGVGLQVRREEAAHMALGEEPQLGGRGDRPQGPAKDTLLSKSQPGLGSWPQQAMNRLGFTCGSAQAIGLRGWFSGSGGNSRFCSSPAPSLQSPSSSEEPFPTDTLLPGPEAI